MALRDDAGRSLEQPTRHGVEMLKRDTIAVLARQLHGITINEVVPEINNNSIKFLLPTASTTLAHPWQCQVKSGSNNTITVGINRTTTFPDIARHQGFAASEDTPEDVVVVNDGFVFALIKLTSLTGFMDVTYADSLVIPTPLQGASAGSGSPSGGNRYQDDVTPHFRVILGFASDVGLSTFSWKQMQFSQIELPSLSRNLFYDESLGTVMCSMIRPGNNLTISIPAAGFTITTNATRDLFVVGTDSLTNWTGFTDEATGFLPSDDRFIKIGIIKTGSSGELEYLTRLECPGYIDTDT